MKLALRILGIILALLVVLTLAVVYFFGPTVGAMLTGKPIFMGHASEKRINTAMLDTATYLGIYAQTPEFEQARERALEDITNRELLAEAIEAAGGKHSGIYETANEQESSDEDVPPTVEERDGQLWVTVPAFSRLGDGEEYARILSDGITSHPGSCAAVVDLRGNRGGDMGPMVAGLSPLLPDGTVLEFVSPMNVTPVKVEGNQITGGGSPTTGVGGKVEMPVAVLVDGDTASSGEATMLSFRGLDYSTSFGEPTAGYASANQVIDYPDGRTLMITTAKDRARTGEEFAEDPIEPDAPLEELDSWLATHCGP